MHSTRLARPVIITIVAILALIASTLISLGTSAPAQAATVEQATTAKAKKKAKAAQKAKTRTARYRVKRCKTVRGVKRCAVSNYRGYGSTMKAAKKDAKKRSTRAANARAKARAKAAAKREYKKRNKIVRFAKKQLGKKYRSGAQGPSAFDCSGLTRYVMRKAIGKNIPAGSYNQIKYGKRSTNKKDLKPGDLVFYYSPISHVGIYIGKNSKGERLSIDAVGAGKGVKIVKMDQKRALYRGSVSLV